MAKAGEMRVHLHFIFDQASCAGLNYITYHDKYIYKIICVVAREVAGVSAVIGGESDQQTQ